MARIHFVILLACLASVTARVTALGDFPELFNSEPQSTETWMKPEQAAEAMQVPPGFRVTPFAAEPNVQNPIAGTWDSRGRLWIAENYTYAERTQKFQLDLRDRVVILDGAEGDHFTQRTVFTDDVQMLTSIEVGRGGVWLMCPPKLIFIPDADQDDIPDGDAEIVLDGFTVAEANYHNFANGLRFGPDGWLYGRCGGSCPGRIGPPGTPDDQRLALEGGIWRYHVDRKVVEVLTTGTTNPWGHDWNEYGEAFYVNTVNGHLWHMIPGAHFTRPFTLDPNGKTYELIDFHADHWHFDTGKSWNQSRDGVANAYGGGHAHCGTMIYQGGRWPSRYNGRLFTFNFHGRRANQEILTRHGTGYIASHGEDVFLAGDPWFRGMDIICGPDGNAFALDWSDTGECHEHTGVHRTSGRIFKICYDDPDSIVDESDLPSLPSNGDLKTWTAAELAQTVLHPNAWYRRQAKIELAERFAAGKDVAPANEVLQAIWDSTKQPSTAVQCQLMLHVIGRQPEKQVHQNEYVQAWKLRLASEMFAIDDAMGPGWKRASTSDENEENLQHLLTMLHDAATQSDSALVHLTVASTLQRLPVDRRAAIAKQLCLQGQHNQDHNLPLMIWYGLMPVAQQSPEQLVDVAATCQLDTTLRLISRALTEQIQDKPDALNRLLTHAAEQSSDHYRATVLQGVAEGVKGWRVAPRPECWDQIVSMKSDSLQPIIRELSVVFGDGRALDELKDIALGNVPADAEMRHSALETLIQSDAEGLREICEALLRDARINVMAARGLSKFDDPQIGKSLAERYRNFRAPQRPKLMSILVSRKSFAMPMLAAIEAGKIERSDLTPYQVRQLMALQDDELSETVRRVWGEVRDTPEAIAKRIEELKHMLTDDYLAVADKSHGRALFAKACQTCHQLYGEGQKVGPDLTGANRSNMDYLLDNVVSPSSVVDKDFRMTLLLLDDDRIVSGLVTSENDRVIEMQTATEKITIDKESVLSQKVTEKSPMPEGLLDVLTSAEIRDLIGYLRHPTQVALAETP